MYVTWTPCTQKPGSDENDACDDAYNCNICLNKLQAKKCKDKYNICIMEEYQLMDEL